MFYPGDLGQLYPMFSLTGHIKYGPWEQPKPPSSSTLNDKELQWLCWTILLIKQMVRAGWQHIYVHPALWEFEVEALQIQA